MHSLVSDGPCILECAYLPYRRSNASEQEIGLGIVCNVSNSAVTWFQASSTDMELGQRHSRPSKAFACNSIDFHTIEGPPTSYQQAAKAA